MEEKANFFLFKNRSNLESHCSKERFCIIQWSEIHIRSTDVRGFTLRSVHLCWNIRKSLKDRHFPSKPLCLDSSYYNREGPFVFLFLQKGAREKLQSQLFPLWLFQLALQTPLHIPHLGNLQRVGLGWPATIQWPRLPCTERPAWVLCWWSPSRRLASDIQGDGSFQSPFGIPPILELPKSLVISACLSGGK